MKTHWFGWLALLLAGSGCKSDSLPGFTTFEVTDTQAVIVPAGQLSTLAPIAVTSHAPAAYTSYNTDADYVQQVTPLGGTLTITDPTSQTFDALSGVTVYISATQAGQDQFEVGTSPAVAAGNFSLPLQPGSTPIDMFVRQPVYYLFVKLAPQQTLRQPTTLRVTLTYKVRARIRE